MIIHNVEQGSGLWLQLRLGKVTASQAHRLLTSAKFNTYYLELLSETLTQVVLEGYTSPHMEWGIEQEPFAMEWYQKHTGVEVTTCGFVEVEGLNAGCSPDLLVGKEGMVQIKCPSPKTHMDYYFNGPDKEIICQMQFEMFCYQAKWNDFLSFDPRYPEPLKGVIKRVERDDFLIKQLELGTKRMNTQILEFIFDRNIDLTKKDVTERIIELEKLAKYYGT